MIGVFSAKHTHHARLHHNSKNTAATTFRNVQCNLSLPKQTKRTSDLKIIAHFLHFLTTEATISVIRVNVANKTKITNYY